MNNSIETIVIATPSKAFSMHNLLHGEHLAFSKNETSLNNYRPDSIEMIITQILAPILAKLKELSLETLPDSKSHIDSLKNYEKILKKTKEIDHVEKVERAISAKGIIGEFDAEAVGRRKDKVEWNACLDVIERLGKRLGKIIKDNPNLGEAFIIEIDAQSSAYPLVLHLLKIIKHESAS